MTLTKLAGTKPDIPQDGASLVPLLEEQASRWRTYALIEMAGKGSERLPGFYGVRDRRWKYVELDTGEEELYNLVYDPYELGNQAHNPGYASIKAELAAELRRLKTSPGVLP
jgi:arylsulfatase A-like enzyme